jgi:uncharacterized SAM-binding protein YcdF (DUF218 family)
MRKHPVTLLELGLLNATRGILGVGIGLLLSGRLRRRRRKNIGMALVAVGALSTIPLALRILRPHGNSRGIAQQGWSVEDAELMAD